MDWIRSLFFDSSSVASALLIYSLVIALGLWLGSLRIGSFELGVAGVLFVGLAFGHFGLKAEPEAIEFVREFGLILFVSAIGLSIGPGFLNALRSQGLRLNGLALSLVFLGAGLTYGVSALGGIAMPIAVGIFSGATTNTPSLAVSSGFLREQPPSAVRVLTALEQAAPRAAKEWRDRATLPEREESHLRAEAYRLPSLGYAVCYPCGILGSLLAI